MLTKSEGCSSHFESNIKSIEHNFINLPKYQLQNTDRTSKYLFICFNLKSQT